METGDWEKRLTTLSQGLVQRDSYTTFLEKKAEKIVAAIYLVTNLLSDKEPLKWTLRHKAVGLLGDFLSFRHEELSPERVAKIVRSVCAIESTLGVAVHGCLVSGMNASVLRTEIQALVGVLEERLQETSIPNSFFGVPEPETHPQKAQASNTNVYGKNRKESKKRGKEQGLKTTSLRQEKVYALIRQKGEVSIGDVALEISDCSEKTLLRDLTSLIGQGKIKRTGKRRWTRYSLA